MRRRRQTRRQRARKLQPRTERSRIVRKYIGQTERHLRRVFDAAEENGAILLFYCSGWRRIADWRC